jgi:hypothetical protein
MMAARYYFDTQGLVRERKVTVQKRAMRRATDLVRVRAGVYVEARAAR